MTVLTNKMTYMEFREMEFDDTDNFQYELLNGELVQKACPEYSTSAYFEESILSKL